MVGLVVGDRLVESRAFAGGAGLSTRLTSGATELLAVLDRPPDLVACLLGPGSFTGLRTGISLAHGLALGFSCALAGATVGEALAFEQEDSGTAPPLWVATASRRGRLFLETGGQARLVEPAAIVPPGHPVRLGGDAAAVVAARLAATGAAAIEVEPALPSPLGIARASLARHLGRLSPERATVPLYVEPPEVSRPSVPPRPAPRG